MIRILIPAGLVSAGRPGSARSGVRVKRAYYFSTFVGTLIKTSSHLDQLMVNEFELELLDPGLFTNTVALPLLARSDAGIATVR